MNWRYDIEKSAQLMKNGLRYAHKGLRCYHNRLRYERHSREWHFYETDDNTRNMPDMKTGGQTAPLFHICTTVWLFIVVIVVIPGVVVAATENGVRITYCCIVFIKFRYWGQ